MTVTLRDIARRANVSTSTVSRVLSDHPHVSDDIRSQVWQIARELRYPLDNLRKGPHVSQTVLLTGMGTSLELAEPQNNNVASHEEFSRLVLKGAQTVFESHGFTVRLQDGRRPNVTLDEEIHEYANDPAIVGLILLGGEVDEDFVCGLRNLGMPLVIAGIHVPELEVDCVMADYTRGIEAAVAHLVEKGRCKIGLVNDRPTTQTTQEKYKVFRSALRLNDCPFHPEQVVSGESERALQEGYTQTLQLLKQVSDIEAIIYSDDFRAAGGLRALRETGKKVPDDVAVVGFHDYDIASFTDPPLTTVHFSMRRMGYIAARRLEMILAEAGEDPWYVTVPTKLIVRESTP